ncbi:MAG: solute carrier family 26 protein [Saprospiraceae bacterium]|nr:solute carrier family 26 protein [Saprospiraceae bacterium]MDG1435789.1 solute carrier family 26 protein [Saprospiraceae bacterium]MDG2419716.1 solute carrier family 26 protein [Saprospiraceae bacterium]
MKLKSFFPIIENFSTHSSQDWRKDVIAGITVAVMLVPQGMAYAMLAGMPPIYGLYGGLIPLLFYAILGTSRQMSIGPVAISALLVLAGVSQIADPMTPEYISLVILTGLLVGIAQFLLGVFRLGFLVNFISHPVIVGFTSAAAIIIAISQLKDLLGISIPRFSRVYETVHYVSNHFSETNWVTVSLCIGSIIIMLTLKKINKAIPGALLVVIVGTLLVYFIGEEKLGIDLVKDVPQGLPVFQMPEKIWGKIQILYPTIFTVTIICIVESIAIAKVLQAKHGDYQIRANQELIALGISKIGGAFFQSIPTSGSFTRSAVNNESGARSGFASIFTATLIGLTLVFLTPLFYFLPKSILAAIILLSVKSLFDWKEAKHLWQTHRSDFYMMLTTFIVTLILGIEEGVLAGVVLSICMVLFRSSKPHIAILGKLPESINYRNIDRFESAKEPEDILVIRFDDQLYFGNASYFQETIQELVNERASKPKMVLLDASSIHDMDSTGSHTLEEMQKYLINKGIIFYISGMIGPVRDFATKCGIIERMGEQKYFLNIHEGVTHFKNMQEGLGEKWTPDALQSNINDI